MKKQYLISLLGLFAIFAPLGNGIVNTKLNSSTNEKTTGIAMKETSKISLIDSDGSKDVSTRDKINSISFDGEWVFENWGGKEYYDVDDPSKEGLNLYGSSKPDEPLLEVSYKTLKNKGTYDLSDDSDILTYSIEANSLNNTEVKIWGYEIAIGETFEITADYNSTKEPKNIKEDNLGTIELTISDPSTIKRTSNVEVTITPLEAKVDYKVIPGLDTSGNLETVEFVRWMNGSWELASSEKEEDTLIATSPKLESDVNYNNTTLIARMSGGWTESVEVDPFNTISKNEPSTIDRIGRAQETSSTEANVNYEVDPGKDVNGQDLTVIEVKWMDGTERLATSTNTKGTLIATDLIPNHSYKNTIIVAEMSDGSFTNDAKINDFKTKKGKTKSSIKEVGTVNVTGPNTANVGYEVTPGTDKNGDLLTVEKVVWIKGAQTDGKPELATDDEDNGIDGILETDSLNPSQKYEKTTLKAKMSDNTWTDPAQVETFTAGQDISTIEQVDNVSVTSYNSASVKYKIHCGKNVDGEDLTVKEVQWVEHSGQTKLASEKTEDENGVLYTTNLEGNLSHDTTLKAQMSDYSWIEIDVRSFETPACNEPSTIEKVDDINVTSSTEANVSYKVNPGKDVYGHPVTVKKVRWMDDNKELTASLDTEGTLYAHDLSPNQTYYNTYIIADMNAGEQTNTVLAGTFTTEPGNVNSKIKEDGEVEVTSSTEANVNYTVTPGKDVDGNDVTVEKVEWINGEDILETNKGNGIDGILEADELSPNQSYNNTKIIAYMSDGTKTRPVKIEPFHVLPGDEPSELNSDGKVDITSSTEANVNYTVTPGKNVDGKDVTVEKVEWINGEEILAIDKGNGIDGILEADELSPNQPYNNTKIIAYMSDGTKTNVINVGSFQAWPGDEPSTIKQDGIVNVTSSTEANVNYTVRPGKDVDGNGLTVIKVKWMNGDDILATSTEASGNLSTNQLIAEQIYDNTTIVAEMSNGTSTNIIEVDPFLAHPSTPVNKPTAINIDEPNGILQVEGNITLNEATAKSIDVNIINEKGDIVTTGCEIIDNGDSISYSVFTDQYNGNIDNYRLQITYEIDGKKQEPLENEYIDIQEPKNITNEDADLSNLIDNDDGDDNNGETGNTSSSKLGLIIGIVAVITILFSAVMGFFLFIKLKTK